MVIEFDGVPFCPIKTQTYDCQHGKQYYKLRERKTNRLCLQSTKKMGCPAHMIVKEYQLYPDYKITEKESKCLKVHELRQLKKERHGEINKALTDNTAELKIEQRYFVSLPTNEAHEKVHPTGIAGGMSQRVHPMISQKIEDLVKEGITDVQEVKRTLRFMVKTEMKGNLPSGNNRAYYPTNTDIQNHIDAAKTAIQLSKFDQISMKALYEEWTKSSRPGKYFFCPYIKKELLPDTVPSVAKEVVIESNRTSSSSSTESPVTAPTPASVPDQSSLLDQLPSHLETPATDLQQPDLSPPDPNKQFSQTLLWIQQEEWQQNLMIRYGNTMSLIDATYKTTKYDLPLFFCNSSD